MNNKVKLLAVLIGFLVFSESAGIIYFANKAQDFSKKFSKLEPNYEKLSQEQKELKDKYDASTKENDAIKADRSNLLAQAKVLIADNSRMGELEEEISKLETEKQDMLKNKEDMNSQNQKLQEVVKQLMNSQSQLTQERDSLKAAYEKAKKEDVVKELKKQIFDSEKENDKAKKLMIGAEFGKKFNPSYLMVVDADDFISNKIAAFVSTKSEQTGYFLDRGYIHESGSSSLYYLRKNFGQYCGTSIIIKPNLFDLAFKNGTYYEHKCSTLTAHNIFLEKLPFCGAIYNRCHGENLIAVREFSQSLRPKGDYFAYIKHLLRFRPITTRIKQEFSFCRE